MRVPSVCVDSVRARGESFYWRRVQHGLMVACAVPCLVTACAYTLGGDWKCGYTVHKMNLEKMVW